MRHRVVGLPDPLPMKRLPDTDLWAVTTVLPSGLARRVPARDPLRRPLRDLQRPAQPAGGALADGVELGLRGDRLRGARLGAPRPGGPAGGAGRGHLPVEGAASRAAGQALPAGPLQPRAALPPAGRPRRRRLPQLRGDEDGAGQPHPPARRGPPHRGVRPAPGPAAGVPEPRAARPVHRARAAAHAGRAAAPGRRPRGPVPDGFELRRDRVPVDGGALPGGLRVAVPAVGVAGLHRHRHRPRRRPGVRPGGEVRQPLPRQADGPGRAAVHELWHLRAADHPEPVDGARSSAARA